MAGMSVLAPFQMSRAGGSAVVNADGSFSFNAAPAKAINIGVDTPPSDSFADLGIWRTTALAENASGVIGLQVIRYGNPSTNFNGRLGGADFTAAVPAGTTGNFNQPYSQIYGVSAAGVWAAAGAATYVSGVTSDVWVTAGSVSQAANFWAYADSYITPGTTTTHVGFLASTFTKAANNWGAILGNGLWVQTGEAILGGDCWHQGTNFGAYNATPIPRQLLATGVGHTVDDVISFLQLIGFVRQV